MPTTTPTTKRVSQQSTLFAHFQVKRKPGRPKKVQQAPRPLVVEELPASKTAPLEASNVNPNPPSKAKKRRGSYVDWTKDKYRDVLDRAVKQKLAGVEDMEHLGIPRATLYRKVAEARATMTPSRHEAFRGGPSVPLNKRKQRSLLSKRNILFLSDTIRSRDRMNNGMSQKDVIVTIMNLVPGISNKQA